MFWGWQRARLRRPYTAPSPRSCDSLLATTTIVACLCESSTSCGAFALSNRMIPSEADDQKPIITYRRRGLAGQTPEKPQCIWISQRGESTAWSGSITDNVLHCSLLCRPVAIASMPNQELPGRWGGECGAMACCKGFPEQ